MYICPSPLMHIGDLAERTNTTPQTIRYYEQLGLLGPVQREGRKYRQYSEEAVARLEKIAMLKQLGLSLEQIRDVIDLYFEDATGIRGKRKVVEMLKKQRRETQEKIGSLQQFLHELDQNIARLEGLIRAIEAQEDDESSQ
ncbi:MerR family transcriptional regulator [Ktedonosporobacter rubrisoli]|nr:MerR family transcriptional regulator [Ktedonosporobacter rubrisoli]